MDRITAIEDSLRVFVLGIIGLLPLVGIIPATMALIFGLRVGSKYGNAWNPASAYLRWGAILALLGLLGSGLVAIVLIWNVVTGDWPSD